MEIPNFIRTLFNKTFKKRPYISVAVTLAVIVAALLVFRGNGTVENPIITVIRGSITEEVSVTGKIKPKSNISLAFERNGKITRINSEVGSRVAAGQVLARMDASELYAQLMQSQAELQTQKSKLNELESGTRAEEIAVYEIQLENADESLDDAKRNLIEKIQDAYTKADDAVRNQADKFFSNGRGTTPTFIVTIYDPQTKTDLENARPAIESALVSWKTETDSLTPQSDTIYPSSRASNVLNQIKTFLDKLASAVNVLQNETYKTNVSSARADIGASISALSAAREKFNTAQSNYLLAKRNLELKRAGYLPEQISAQEAQVQMAEASVNLIQSQIAKTELKSPIGGVITKQDAEVGEMAAANSPIITVMSDSALEIEANIPEVDVVKIKIGDTVRINLDALAREEFLGKVIYIEPAETIIDGVVNFKIKIAFDKTDERIKSGLTTNLDIQTETKNNVLILPQYAILEKDDGIFVKTVPGGSYESSLANTGSNKDSGEIPVKIGLRSPDGLVEIISGLNEGDKVLNIGVKTSK